MKTTIKAMILVSLLTTISVAVEESDRMRKQCQYVVYGSGNNDNSTDIFMRGLLFGIDYMSTKHGGGSVRQVIRNACKKSLNSDSGKTFSHEFKQQLALIIRN